MSWEKLFRQYVTQVVGEQMDYAQLELEELTLTRILLQNYICDNLPQGFISNPFMLLCSLDHVNV